MIKAGVIGYPIEHSLSPIIHNFWLKKFDIRGSYEKILVKPQDLGKRVKWLQEEGFAGINVTVPHKEKILKYMDQVTEQAEAIGAVNTVIFKNGKILGDNTDKFGFWFSLQSNGYEAYAEEGKAVILGVGGAARSIIANLTGKKKIIIVHRPTSNKADEIIKDFSPMFPEGVIEKWDWDNKVEAFEGANLLVNATVLGMKGQPEDPNIDFTGLQKEALVYDVVYNPLETNFIRIAKKRGYRTLGGLDMLIGQAIPAFTEWYGKNPGTISPELKEELLKALEGR